jgi:ABC-type multidrug transport system fused ATPase/permease subunit
MNKNIFSQAICFFKEILDFKQKKLALTLLAIMVFAVIFEILLLNNLMLLLNYLTNSNNLVTPEILTWLMNFFSAKNPASFALIIFIFTFFLKTLITIIVRWRESRFIFKIKAEISEALYTGYLKLPFIFHQRTHSAKILKNITLEIEQFSVFLSAASKSVLDFLVLVGITFYLMFVNPYITLACISAFILFGYAFNLINRSKLQSMGISRIFHQDERMKAIIETLSGLREIKLLSSEESKLKNFRFHNNKIAKILTSIAMRNAFSKPSFEIFMLVVLSGFIFYFLSNNLLNAELIPIIGIYLAAAYRLIPAISTIVQSIQDMQFNLKSVKNLYDDIKKFKINELNNIEKKQEKIEFKNKIEIKNLYFSYDNDGRNSNGVLNNINLEIQKGDFVGIQGESGSGKSTFIDILLGLHSIKKGFILVDDKDIHKGVKSWQSLIGCVPQEVFIMDDSLKKNIAFGVSEDKISSYGIERSLEFSNLKKFTSLLPNQTDTTIGEKGSKLSGGQKQRIGIARAIYNNPEILILDEPTNSLDNETEDKIIKEINLLRKNKTIIIVSHNSEILKNCDYILKITNKIIEKVPNKV